MPQKVYTFTILMERNLLIIIFLPIIQTKYANLDKEGYVQLSWNQYLWDIWPTKYETNIFEKKNPKVHFL